MMLISRSQDKLDDVAKSLGKRPVCLSLCLCACVSVSENAQSFLP